MKTLCSRLALSSAAFLTLLVSAPSWAQNVQPRANQGAATVQHNVAMCIGCHGIPDYRASFPEVHKVPMISGQNAKYIVAALQAYQKGDRKHPTMRGIAASLSEQDMAQVAAYYEGHGKDAAGARAGGTGKLPSSEVDALLKKGACMSCHGENMNKPIDASYPKLAGQHPDYLYVALKSYQTANNQNIGRNNAIMAGQVKQFTHRELRLMADYIGSLPGDMKTVAQPRFK